ncbi:inner membrane protein CreD-like protein [alpha proteobacterium U9-1i]|nr:inner membrane protein CreD-like protein [alpha proteobacterium U9-1i]
MTEPLTSKLIPRGSLGLKMLLVCFLVLLMGIPLITVGAIVADRQRLAQQVTAEIGERAGGQQTVGGPMLIIPYTRSVQVTDAQGVTRPSIVRSYYAVFAEEGSADSALTVQDLPRGIYRAATYQAVTAFTARFRPRDALADLDPSYILDWSGAQILMYVRDSRAIRDTAEIAFSDGSTATLEPFRGLSVYSPGTTATMSTEPRAYVEPSNLQTFAARTAFTDAPEEFEVRTRLTLGGAQRFAIAAFAQDTTGAIRGNRTDVNIQGYFQRTDAAVAGQPRENGALQPPPNGFAATWRVPFAAGSVEKAADLNVFNLGDGAGRDMAVSFVSADDVYNGVQRAVRYGIMFIGIVFLATLIFEALSGKKAHPAQYILVGLAQSVFYLLLLAITEIIGFTGAFVIAAAATVALLAYYAGASSGSVRVGASALAGLSVLYGVMYVLMTIEDFAFFAGSVVAFLVIAAAMIATRRINWYGRETATEAPAPA